MSKPFASLALFATLTAAACGGGPKPSTTTGPTAAGGGAAAAVTVQQIDWLNRTYDPGVIPPVTLIDGAAELALGEDEPGSFELSRPPDFVDLTGDGADEAILFTVLHRGTGFTTAVDVWTIRDGKEVLLARLDGGDGHIGDANPVAGILNIERQVTVDGQRKLRHEEWSWNGAALVEDETKRTFEDDHSD
ncbi:MAG: hypothetical protein K8M05_18230 [Deltaproteobacteria bacterium]|nr:hypothetical protein [Kofleriaceae bacterium]